MGQQVQCVAEEIPGDEDGEEGENEDHHPGNLHRHKAGQGLGGMGRDLGCAVIQGLLEGVRKALEGFGVLERFQQLV